MSAPDIGSIVGLFRHVHRLKTTPRTGWLRHGIEKPESIAAHAYGVALLAWVLAGRDVDVGKALKMALVHDLGEALAGDLTPQDKGYERESIIVAEKLREIVSPLPEGLRNEFVSLYGELVSMKTEEARLVNMADDLDLALTATEYQRSGPDLREFLDVDERDFTERGRELIKYLKRLGDSE
ncbi:MAG: HD domain-containing protein [Candidatus Aenigmarchaeota archaeon]|nr:HD domain-containing protein [Candidatus Aenigmarchaeota archaeon]